MLIAPTLRPITVQQRRGGEGRRQTGGRGRSVGGEKEKGDKQRVGGGGGLRQRRRRSTAQWPQNEAVFTLLFGRRPSLLDRCAAVAVSLIRSIASRRLLSA